jgi:ABC-type sugar transport system permease subunit
MRSWIDRHFGRGNWRVVLFCYVALLPVPLLFAYVRLVPIVESFILSFYKWELLSRVIPTALDPDRLGAGSIP